MNEKYYYTEAFCRYRQLMPVKYEKQTDGKWRKIGMACNNAQSCGKSLNECEHFRIAPEIITTENLRDKKIE